jgi:hypothetical protein
LFQKKREKKISFYSKKAKASSSFFSSLLLIGRSGDGDELRFFNLAGGRVSSVK